MISGLYRFEPMVTSHMRRTCQSKTAHLMTGKQSRIKWPGPYSSPGRHVPEVVTLSGGPTSHSARTEDGLAFEGHAKQLYEFSIPKLIK